MRGLTPSCGERLRQSQLSTQMAWKVDGVQPIFDNAVDGSAAWLGGRAQSGNSLVHEMETCHSINARQFPIFPRATVVAGEHTQ